MRQLRLVTLADDGSHLLVETPDGGERFGLPVDSALRGALGAGGANAAIAADGTNGADPATPAPGLRPQLPAGTRPVAVGMSVTETGDAPIGPREIQVRVRSGESPQHLADAYGMTLERVMRFATPVVEERLRISGEARRARARRNTTDGQVVVFGEAVDERFAAYGIAADTVTWDAHRRDDGEWVIVATWAGGDGTHTAHWVFTRSSRSVTAIDDAAADLLSDRPIRPVVPPEPERPALVAAPPLRPGVVAFPPMPDAHTGPLPRIEEVFDQEAPPEGPRLAPPLVTTATRAPVQPTGPTGPTAAPEHGVPEHAPEHLAEHEHEHTTEPAAVSFDHAPLDFEEPPLPLGITDPSTRPGAVANITGLRTLGSRRGESDEEKAARARVPSWDDILLGVRRKSD